MYYLVINLNRDHDYLYLGIIRKMKTTALQLYVTTCAKSVTNVLHLKGNNYLS